MTKPTGPKMACAIFLIFWVAAIPSGAQVTFTVLARFDGINGDGSWTAPLVQGADGNFFGTSGGGDLGKGTVFKISSGGTLTRLYSFSGPDGYGPAGLVQGTDLNFYGVTEAGGVNPCGCGTIFKITSQGIFTSLHSLNITDGAGPVSGLIQGTDGNFYGTTQGGGPNYEGEVYKVTPYGTLTVVYGFSGLQGTGDSPYDPMVQGGDGNFYGTTHYNGIVNDMCRLGCGTVFQLTPDGTLTTLHNFDGTDGAGSTAGLFHAMDGNFYGTSQFGGNPTCGGRTSLTWTRPCTKTSGCTNGSSSASASPHSTSSTIPDCSTGRSNFPSTLRLSC